MTLFFALIPLLLSVLAIALFKQSALRAGLIGIVCTIAIILTWPTYQIGMPLFGRSLQYGVFNTLNISLILLGGVLLYRVLDQGGALNKIAESILRSIDEPVHRLFALVFGASVFFESATGFGVGIVVVAPLFMALGYAPMQAAVLALLGQCAVPWGALAIGTLVGAELSGVSEVRLGALCALFALPVTMLFGYFALRISDLLSRRALMLLCVYSAGLSFLLLICTLLVGVELAGCLAGLLVVAVAVIVASSGEARAQEQFPFAAFFPFVVLMLSLCLTRLIPELKHSLQSIELKVFTGLSIAPFYHAGTYLLLSALVGLLLFNQARKNAYQLIVAAVRQWWLATLAVGSFVMLGQLMTDSGMTQSIALGIAQATSGYYPLAAPMIGALGGFLTASNTASNALFMDLQVTVATELSLPKDAIAAAQNAAGSNVTLASPGRLIFAASIVGQSGAESLLLGRVALVTLAGVVSTSLISVMLCWWL